MATVWWGCNYTAISLFNATGYYYLPAVPADRQVWQSVVDTAHTICFVVGGTVGGMTGQYWYLFLTR